VSQPAPPGHSLPSWLIAVAWIPFTIGLALTFNARMQDVPWMLLLVYLALFGWMTPGQVRHFPLAQPADAIAWAAA
jgi:hypothetical protein